MKLLPLVLALFSFPALAELYSWNEAGSMRFTNAPPAWYRLEDSVRGPRVVVLSNDGWVVDDTALSMEARWRLRGSHRHRPPRDAAGTSHKLEKPGKVYLPSPISGSLPASLHTAIGAGRPPRGNWT